MLSARIELILLITGLVTTGALLLFLVPVTMMKVLFGQAPPDALSRLIVRHWGLLVRVEISSLVMMLRRPPSR